MDYKSCLKISQLITYHTKGDCLDDLQGKPGAEFVFRFCNLSRKAADWMTRNIICKNYFVTGFKPNRQLNDRLRIGKRSFKKVQYHDQVDFNLLSGKVKFTKVKTCWHEKLLINGITGQWSYQQIQIYLQFFKNIVSHLENNSASQI